MKKLVIGILAHVDAGKTTLSEGMLYLSGALRKLGRVDHQDAFLDNFSLERQRGITIFSKQAELTFGDTEVTLLDTPGHVDFSAEMERTLQVLDYAILVISGTDGVQSHTETLWKLLRQRNIPTFLFINKMDLAGADRERLMEELQRRLGEGCVDFTAGEDSFMEAAAMTDEGLLDRYLSCGTLTEEELADGVRRCCITPCCFGAALQLEGVETFMQLMERYTRMPAYGDTFSGRVFKIARDSRNERLTYLKVTGGSLRVRDLVSDAAGSWEEKVNQIRIYSGAKFKTVEEAPAGTVCAVTGLTRARAWDGLGAEPEIDAPVLEPVLNYRMLLPEGCSAHTILPKLRLLEEEDPALRVVWNEALGEICLQLMGEVQIEVLTELIAERFGVQVSFDSGRVVYKETIAAPSFGIGHFEPLRHYAEVHLLLEPLPRGSGMQFATACAPDSLDINWQRLIMTHLMEKTHVGVLTGAPVTDLKITLIAGRAHLKHTEGGDFRQASYRAVRHGLMGAESILLEPWYQFRIEVPQEALGRAMNDLQRLGGSIEAPELLGEFAVLTGSVSVEAFQGYGTELAAYSKGRGRLSCEVLGYRPCHNAEEVIAESGYDPERDLENTADSVFCSHGAGFNVPWQNVAAYAHIKTGEELQPARSRSTVGAGSFAGDSELLAIFERTYGPIKNRGMDALAQSRHVTARPSIEDLSYIHKDDVLLVDGYNMIFGWEDLKAIAKENLDAARAALIHQLCNYQGMRQCRVIVVFDAYRVKGGVGASEKEAGVEIVYTEEGETADTYIERMSYELGKTHRVKVATGDGMEQIVVLGHGAQRLSAREMKWEIDQARQRMEAFLEQQ